MLENLLIFFMQTAQTATAPAIAQSAPIDINTLITSLAALGGVGYAILKTLSSKMEKSKNESIRNAGSMILTNILPLLEQNKKFVDNTANQDVKIDQITTALYDYMGEDANKITGLEEIKKRKVIIDAAVSAVEKQQYEEKLKQVEDLKIKLGLIQAPTTTTTTTPTATSTAPAPATTQQPSIVWDEATKSWISK
jgi:hypothetical protein